MYVTAHFIQWEGDRDGQMFLIPKVSEGTMGCYDPFNDVIIISAVAIYKDMFDNDEGAWEALVKEGSMFRPYLKAFICTTNHELLHSLNEIALPATCTDAECEAQFVQEEWVIDRMGWT